MLGVTLTNDLIIMAYVAEIMIKCGKCTQMHMLQTPVYTMISVYMNTLGHNNVLHSLRPPPSTKSQHYNLRHCAYTLQLPPHTTHLLDRNFITRMMYKCLSLIHI